MDNVEYCIVNVAAQGRGYVPKDNVGQGDVRGTERSLPEYGCTYEYKIGKRNYAFTVDVAHYSEAML